MGLNLGMKKFKIIILILSILFFTNNLKADVNLSKPLWNQVSELTCKGKFRMECTNGDCTKHKSTAIWKIDFLNSSVVYLNMDFKEKIHSMKHEYYDMMNRASNTIHFGTRLMAFEIDNIQNFSKGIPSVVLGADINDNGVDMDVASTHFECSSSE